MSNRCRRCNRKLSNAEALYGWRCAEILGIAETASKLPYKDFRFCALRLLREARHRLLLRRLCERILHKAPYSSLQKAPCELFCEWQGR